MTEIVGMPGPLLGEDGFPLCLTELRTEVEARGGRIVGDQLTWRVTHPEQKIPDIEIEFFPEGTVLVSAGDNMWVEEFYGSGPHWSERVADDTNRYTWPEAVVLGFINGAAVIREWQGETGDTEYLVEVDTPAGHERRVSGRLPDDAREVCERRYPAWPQPAA